MFETANNKHWIFWDLRNLMPSHLKETCAVTAGQHAINPRECFVAEIEAVTFTVVMNLLRASCRLFSVQVVSKLRTASSKIIVPKYVNIHSFDLLTWIALDGFKYIIYQHFEGCSVYIHRDHVLMH